MVPNKPIELRRANGRYVITLPTETVEALGMKQGDLLFVDVRPAVVSVGLAPDLAAYLDAFLAENETLYRELGDE